MPTYDYQCEACGHKFELYQSILADPETKCPECKKKKLRRLIGTGGAIVFKGSGFYQTDYRSDSYKKSAASDKGSGDKSSGSGEKSSGSSEKSSGGESAKPSGDKPAKADAPKKAPKSDS